ncbi:MAG: SPOR domain-containing protein [Candidatus Neomarinimicrobiota bacterium]|jgi:cell division septation protein DedD|nr:SPOR domain-containing protein [Candidatus Neomarinimicrobiota bacterium]MDD3966626.1 SPOR domain-containing protein [Candidatus Neomarinimicrobiota bacterium]MDX9779808.1 SPOR domain-containing protein [bacterium]
MMKKQVKWFLIISTVFLLFRVPLPAQDILKILEGYGRDSVEAFSLDDAQEEAARLFNLILEPNGEIAAQRAEQYLSESKSGPVKAYLCVMLADYAFVNKRDSQGLSFLKRAVEEYDPIRNDSYYRLVFFRSQKQIEESPGKTEANKSSVITEFTPKPVSTETATSPKTDPGPPAPANVPPAVPEQQDTPVKIVNYRIQIGAFSLQENAWRKQEFFEKEGYDVEIEKRESTTTPLYLVRVGGYENYEEARQALSLLKSRYPSEEGIVVKTVKK